MTIIGTMVDPVVITVTGRAAPQGSKRSYGPGRMVESSKYVKPWREAVKAAVADCTDFRFPERVPLYVQVTFCFDKPKSAPKRRRIWPVTRSTGDVDKLQRSTFDALTDSGLIRDDAQIVCVLAVKCYIGDPGTPLTAPGAVINVSDMTPRDPELDDLEQSLTVLGSS